MYGYIYLTTDLLNGKLYVGQKKGAFDKNYYGSGKLLKPRLKKYGRNNFLVEVLQWCETFEDTNLAEQFWIKKLNTQDPEIGYNITDGGQGISGIDPGYHDGMKGKHQSDYQKECARKACSRKRTLQERANYSEGQKGKIIPANRKPVRCIETGEVFERVLDAQSKYGGHIAEAARGLRNTAGGYHWEFVNKQSLE